MATQINADEINTSGNNLQYSTSNGVVANHKETGIEKPNGRIWFKYSADTAQSGGGANGVWTGYQSRLTNNGNVGNCFNTTTGRFTAPRAGLYQFQIAHITQNNNSDTRVAMYLNGSYHYRRSIVVHTTAPHHNNCNQGHVFYLGEGDYVEAANHSGGGTHNGDWNFFSGVYVGEYV